jgi:hypothetical protein
MDEITTRLRNVELARESLFETNEELVKVRERREVAINAMIDYALAAYVAGDSIESIMDATEFQGVPGGNGMPPGLAQLFGVQESPSRVQGFAQWLGNVFSERILERHEAENPE